MQDGDLFTWRDVSLRPVALLWRESAPRAMAANDARMFLAFKGHPHPLEDVK